MLNFKSHYTFYFYEMIGTILGDFFYIIFFSMMTALLVELPCSSLWRRYADFNFLSPKVGVDKVDLNLDLQAAKNQNV